MRLAETSSASSPSHLSLFAADRWNRNLQAWPRSFRSVSLFGPHAEEELVLAAPRTITSAWEDGMLPGANHKGHRSGPLNLTAAEHVRAPIWKLCGLKMIGVPPKSRTLGLASGPLAALGAPFPRPQK